MLIKNNIYSIKNLEEQLFSKLLQDNFFNRYLCLSIKKTSFSHKRSIFKLPFESDTNRPKLANIPLLKSANYLDDHKYGMEMHHDFSFTSNLHFQKGFTYAFSRKTVKNSSYSLLRSFSSNLLLATKKSTNYLKSFFNKVISDTYASSDNYLTFCLIKAYKGYLIFLNQGTLYSIEGASFLHWRNRTNVLYYYFASDLAKRQHKFLNTITINRNKYFYSYSFFFLNASPVDNENIALVEPSFPTEEDKKEEKDDDHDDPFNIFWSSQFLLFKN